MSGPISDNIVSGNSARASGVVAAAAAGRTGTVDWVTTAKTGTVTAVSGEGYFVNTTGGAITVNLPAGTAGDIVSLSDYAETWNGFNVTVAPNGSDKIGSANTNAVLSTRGQSVTFVYVDGTEGWVNTMDSTSNVRGAQFIIASGGNQTPGCGITCGDYKTHIFTGPGTFCVTQAGNACGCNSIDYLVVAGGGGGSNTIAGGGGAGGFRTSNGLCMPGPTTSPLAAAAMTMPGSAAYPITVGGGGPGPTKGSDSVFISITSTGGGAGGPNPGGSGGGGNWNDHHSIPNLGGTGNEPPVSPPQGNDGGINGPKPAGQQNSGGGGGAGAVGAVGLGAGGIGSYISDTMIGPTAGCYGIPGPVGSSRYYAGGGGGSARSATGAAGGVGGGGLGGKYSPGIDGVSGIANTGGGSGGNGPGAGTGGSGIVVMRYKFQ